MMNGDKPSSTEIHHELSDVSLRTAVDSKHQVTGQFTHIMLLVHGYFGLSSDYKHFETILHERLDKNGRTDVMILTADCNHRKTYDGVAAGGTRLKEYLFEKTAHINHPVKLSLVGHSLGGLYCRYLLKFLHSDDAREKFELDTFISLATPHLGSRKIARKFGFAHSIPNWISQSILSTTLRDLLLETDLLHEMATSDVYLEPLRRFKHLYAYSNIRFDAAVSYSTAAIRRRSPFPEHMFDFPRMLKHMYAPSILHEDEFFKGIKELDIYLSRPSSISKVEEMARSLEKLNWTRYAVYPDRFLLSHVDIISFYSSSRSRRIVSDHILERLVPDRE